MNMHIKALKKKHEKKTNRIETESIPSFFSLSSESQHTSASFKWKKKLMKNSIPRTEKYKPSYFTALF